MLNLLLETLSESIFSYSVICVIFLVWSHGPFWSFLCEGLPLSCMWMIIFCKHKFHTVTLVTYKLGKRLQPGNNRGVGCWQGVLQYGVPSSLGALQTQQPQYFDYRPPAPKVLKSRT